MSNSKNQKGLSFVATAGAVGFFATIGYAIYRHISEKRKYLTLDALRESVVDSSELRSLLKDEKLI